MELGGTDKSLFTDSVEVSSGWIKGSTPMAQAHQKQVDENFTVFSRLLPGLLKTHPGKFVVMHDGKLIDYFDTVSDAVRFGHAKFGDMDFSVQEITPEKITLGFHSYALHQPAD
jgi:hypothetical protein